MGESWNQEIQISAFCFSNFRFSLFHLIPLNSTWFQLIPLLGGGDGGGPRSQIWHILPKLNGAQTRHPSDSRAATMATIEPFDIFRKKSMEVPFH